MWTFTELKPDETEKVMGIFKAESVQPSFYTSPYALNTFLNHGYKKLYIASNGNNYRIILHRTRKVSDVRILFKRGANDSELIEDIKEKFNPLYIAYNLLSEESEGDMPKSSYDEMIIDTKTIAEMVDKKIGHAYRYFTTKHPNIEFKIAELSHKNKIMTFLDEWCPVFSETHGQLTDGINDRRFLELYLDDKNAKGLLLFDGDKVVGISFFVPHIVNGVALGLINKCLRGYSELGVGLYVNKARLMLENGFLKANTGGGLSLIQRGNLN